MARAGATESTGQLRVTGWDEDWPEAQEVPPCFSSSQDAYSSLGLASK